MRNPNCRLCPLHEGARTVCVPGDGPKDADILVVGPNPGAQEDRDGKPFVGPSGKLLKAQVAKAGDNRLSYVSPGSGFISRRSGALISTGNPRAPSTA